MRLSDAIRLGSMTTQQIFGASLTDDRLGACALGAAMIACGLADDEEDDLMRLFPILRARVVRPTDPSAGRLAVREVIVSLNDRAHWSRERIADWVETLEPKTVSHVS